jgi:hypothetical protein
MAKVPSIDADIKLGAGAAGVRLVAGSETFIMVRGSDDCLPVRVLDLLTSAKTREAVAGNEAFAVLLLIKHPKVSYASVARGVEFQIIDGGKAVGSGKVLSRVDL